MSTRLPTTPGGWTSFIDAWAQYHKVSMHENARGALCNAFAGLSDADVAMLQAAPVPARYLTPDDVIVYGANTTMGYPPAPVPTRPVTSVVKGVPVSSGPVQSIAQPKRVTRTPPRTAPSPAAPVARGRIVRRAVGAK